MADKKYDPAIVAKAVKMSGQNVHLVKEAMSMGSASMEEVAEMFSQVFQNEGYWNMIDAIQHSVQMGFMMNSTVYRSLALRLFFSKPDKPSDAEILTFHLSLAASAFAKPGSRVKKTMEALLTFIAANSKPTINQMKKMIAAIAMKKAQTRGAMMGKQWDGHMLCAGFPGHVTAIRMRILGDQKVQVKKTQIYDPVDGAFTAWLQTQPDEIVFPEWFMHTSTGQLALDEDTQMLHFAYILYFWTHVMTGTGKIKDMSAVDVSTNETYYEKTLHWYATTTMSDSYLLPSTAPGVDVQISGVNAAGVAGSAFTMGDLSLYQASLSAIASVAP